MTDLGSLAVALASLHRLGPDDATLVGIGWATVDTDRTLAAMAGDGGPAFGPRVEEPALGARARVAWSGRIAIVVLEPSTEGRLAAALARRGEGIACLYLTSPAIVADGRPTALGRTGRLLPHDRPWGPYLLIVGSP